MAVLIGHASIDENGRIAGGKVGDQTGREVCTRRWYSKPWNVMLICTDKAIAKKAAQLMRDACANNGIGYDQSQRTTAYTSALRNGRSFKAPTVGETDCSQLIASCYILAGLTSISPHAYTGNLRSALLATGKFKAHTSSAYLNTDAYAEIGTVYLREGQHVVMALENGNKASSSTPAPSTPSTSSAGTCTIKLKTFVKGNKDPQVRMIQRLLKELGYKGKDGKVLSIDGDFGANTEHAVVKFQTDKKIPVVTKGTVGAKTYTALFNA